MTAAALGLDRPMPHRRLAPVLATMTGRRARRAVRGGNLEALELPAGRVNGAIADRFAEAAGTLET